MSIKCDSKLLVKPLFFLVIVDTINGFFLNKGMESSIGIIFKAFILSVAFKILCSSPRFKGLLFFTVIYIPAFLLLVILNTDSQIVPTINHLLKFVNVVFIYYPRGERGLKCCWCNYNIQKHSVTLLAESVD